MADKPTGRKDDQDKPKWNLLPFSQMQDVVKVLTQGEKKYGAHNWQHVPNPRERYFAAAMRHLTAWQAGETIDPDDNLPALAHAVCCLLFMMWFDDKDEEESILTDCAPKVVIRCECGGEHTPTIDIVRDNYSGVVWECGKCHKTIMIVQ